MLGTRSFRRSLRASAPQFVQPLEMREEDGLKILECHVDGCPKPEIRWEKSGKPVGKSRRIHMVRCGDMCLLQIRMFQADDSGQYTCIATNIVGTVSTHIKVGTASQSSIEKINGTSCLTPFKSSGWRSRSMERSRESISEKSSHQFLRSTRSSSTSRSSRRDTMNNNSNLKLSVLPNTICKRNESPHNLQVISANKIELSKSMEDCRKPKKGFFNKVKVPDIFITPKADSIQINKGGRTKDAVYLLNGHGTNSQSKYKEAKVNGNIADRSLRDQTACPPKVEINGESRPKNRIALYLKRFENNDSSPTSKDHGIARGGSLKEVKSAKNKNKISDETDSKKIFKFGKFIGNKNSGNIKKSTDDTDRSTFVSHILVDSKDFCNGLADSRSLKYNGVSNNVAKESTNATVMLSSGKDLDLNRHLNYKTEKTIDILPDIAGFTVITDCESKENIKKMTNGCVRMNALDDDRQIDSVVKENLLEAIQVNELTRKSLDNDREGTGMKKYIPEVIQINEVQQTSSDTDRRASDVKEDVKKVLEISELQGITSGSDRRGSVVKDNIKEVIRISELNEKRSDGDRGGSAIKDSVPEVIQINELQRKSSGSDRRGSSLVNDDIPEVIHISEIQEGLLGSDGGVSALKDDVSEMIQISELEGKSSGSDRRGTAMIDDVPKVVQIKELLRKTLPDLQTEPDVTTMEHGQNASASETEIPSIFIQEVSEDKGSEGTKPPRDPELIPSNNSISRKQCKGKIRPVIEEECEALLDCQTQVESLESDLQRVSSPVESPARIVKGPQSVTVLRGESVTLAICFTGNPVPNVLWMKGGRVLQYSDDSRLSILEGREMSVVTVNEVTADDSGKYVVCVENEGGGDSRFASVAVVGFPEPPGGEPTASEVTDHSIVLSWYGSMYDGGSVVTGYIVEMCTFPDKKWYKVASSVNTSCTVQGLSMGQRYLFRVRAENRYGVSHPSKESKTICLNDFLQYDTSSDEEPENEPENPVTVENGNLFTERFDLKEEVGKGRFGTVYRCVELSCGRPRAAKIIRCLKMKDKEKVRQEIEIMSRLHHPKLMQVLAAFESGRNMIMVMEFISGGELFERVIADDFVLTEHDCILFMKQICDGVAYMHRSDILHLDLKPENILCKTRTSHKIKIIDFGLARVYNSDENLRILFGTPEFVAPEIINYEPVSPASDMWSVGVICYVLLSGLSPFMGDNDTETFANITRGEMDFDDEAFDQISQDAKSFISKLLIKRIKERMSAEECLKHPWLATARLVQKRPLSTEKLKRFIIRRKWQKSGTAIRALGRMVSLSRSSLGSSCDSYSPIGSPTRSRSRSSVVSRSETTDSADSDVFHDVTR